MTHGSVRRATKIPTLDKIAKSSKAIGKPVR
jgi:hypothetical protein